MEDNNNKLGDFFRKRLSSLEGEDQDWFNPDPRTDNLIVNDLVAASERKKSKNRRLLLIFPCLLFLGMSGYILHLKKQITSLSNPATTIITPKKAAISTTNNLPTPLTTTKDAHLSTINETNTDQEKALKILVNDLQTQNKQLQKIIHERNKAIRTLNLELNEKCTPPNSNLFARMPTIGIGIGAEPNDKTNQSIFNQTAPSIQTKGESTELSSDLLLLKDHKPNEFSLSASNDVLNFQKLAAIKPELLSIKFAERVSPVDDYTFNLKNKKKRKFKSFEFGFQAGLYTLLTEKRIDITNQRIIAGAPTVERLIAPYIGLNFAYSPVKNFWIRIGVRGGGNTDHLGQKMGIVYDDKGEYSLPSGDVGSDFILNTSTGYTNIKNTLKLIVPATAANGDLFELEYQEQLKTMHFQIPLTVEYFFGSRKWQPFVYSGVKWNTFHYEYKASSINLVSKNQAINFDANESNTNTTTLQYLSFLTGAGLNWNIRSHLSLRTSVEFESNILLNQPKTSTTNYSKNGLSANIGLHYKF